MPNCSQMPDTFVRGQRISIYKHVFSPGPEDYKHTQLSRFSHIAQHTHTHTHLYFYSILVRVLLSFITQKSHVCIACQRFSSSLTYKFHLFSCLLTESIFGLLHSFYIILFHDSRTNEKRVHLHSSLSPPPPSFLFSLLSLFLHFASVHIAEALNPCRNFQKQRKKKWFPVTVATMSKSPLFLSGKSQRLEV